MSNSGKVWGIREAYKKQRGNQWIEPGNIGLYGGNNPEANTVEQINISTNGNATDFGDLTESVKKTAAAGALTRTVRCGNVSLFVRNMIRGNINETSFAQGDKFNGSITSTEVID